MKTRIITHTNGRGLWSRHIRRVVITALSIDYATESEGRRHGELCATFSARDWDVRQRGLIYTDSLWIKEFRAGLRLLGLSREGAASVTYSEQGMQGRDYVSLDIGDAFLRSRFVAHYFSGLQYVE